MKFFPGKPAWRNQRVGKLGGSLAALVPDTKLERSAIPFQRWVDAVVKVNGIFMIIEFKRKLTDSAIGQVEGYIQEFPDTPEFQDFKPFEVKGMIVAFYDDPIVRQRAQDKGIVVDIYKSPRLQQLIEE